MLRVRRHVYWPACIVAYWLCGCWLLSHEVPLFADQSSVIASLHWGRPHIANFVDYNQSLLTRLSFQYTYWVTATVITVVGCWVTPWLVGFSGSKGLHLFLLSSAVALLSLLLVAGISDSGTALHIWRGPRIYGSLSSTLVLVKVSIPMSLLGGLIAFTRDHLKT